MDWVRLQFTVRDPDSESASGSQKAKITHKTEFIFENFQFEEQYRTFSVEGWRVPMELGNLS